MRVEFERSGGFAGLVLHAVLDTSELDPEQAGQAEAALDTLGWDQPATPPQGADLYQYRFTVTDAAGRRRSAVLNELQVPAALRPLVRELVARGRLPS
ncbi:protealysin inhibitor emfourin [Frankia sp. CiP1_Cm_nod2]|uniref:protealysin inhibitor emfourin n=1 Tax=Frankia sp. CiP1_Cm_nod2 TaxID=2897161 RepID=UPI0020242AE8